ncbi:DNA replication/repair protein RecF [Actinospica sp.]|uniref:DNA replication/repair protein RecF n=1 Tax=Actinospica sp. TaxID=1872142 RepID=UPI002C728180|nr:DNA replication/repair protein RecF [Actinospica sp.]HWG26864.1 DNA replication/repair protein RecF [Actinospica sp.]
MHLTRLALTDFRCYPAADVPLEPGVTSFTGANGEGKTNLVEAVGYVATLASHRVATDAPLVRSGAERAIVRAAVTAADRSSLVEIEINPSRANRARLNRAAVQRPRQVLGVLHAVLFAPEDLALVKGDPGERRRYLDDLLIQSAPRYAGVRSDYDRVVRQRTALLKSARARPPGNRPMLGALDAWDEQLVRTGAELMAGRLELVGALRPLAVKAYAAVSGDECAVELTYRPSLRDKAEPAADQEQLAASLREALAESRGAELERAVCLVGPHRDELELRIGELPARGYASHGESWSFALALRLAGYELLRSSGDDPVLLLDDVFAELDGQRRDRLAALAAAAEQVIVTAAVPADLPTAMATTRFDVSGGVITRAG